MIAPDDSLSHEDAMAMLNAVVGFIAANDDVAERLEEYLDTEHPESVAAPLRVVDGGRA